MKKVSESKSDELRPEYKRSDFGEMVRGKYASRAAVATNVVVLDPLVAKAFPTDQAVNQALQSLIDIAKASAGPTRRSSGRAGEGLQLGERRGGAPLNWYVRWHVGDASRDDDVTLWRQSEATCIYRNGMYK